MNDEGQGIRSRFKKEIGKTITAAQYCEWTAAKTKVGQLNKFAKPETRKKLMATEEQLRQGLLDQMPVLEQVAAVVSDTNNTVLEIGTTQAMHTDMLGYPNRGTLGKARRGSTVFYQNLDFEI